MKARNAGVMCARRPIRASSASAWTSSGMIARHQILYISNDDDEARGSRRGDEGGRGIARRLRFLRSIIVCGRGWRCCWRRDPTSAESDIGATTRVRVPKHARAVPRALVSSHVWTRSDVSSGQLTSPSVSSKTSYQANSKNSIRPGARKINIIIIQL